MKRKVVGLPAWGWLCILLVAAVGVGGSIALSGGDDNSKSTSTTIITLDTTPTSETLPVSDDTTAPTLTTPADTEPDITEPEITEPTVSNSTDEVAGAPAGQRGTRDAPVAAGGIADIGGGWRLQVLGVTFDATNEILAYTDFNDPPPAGSTFTLIKVAMGYFGIEDPRFAFEPSVSALGGASVELTGGCGSIPDELNTFRDVFAGGVLMGNLCFVTPPADAGKLQLYAIGGSFFEDTEVYLEATQPAAATPMATLKGPQTGATKTPARLAPTAVGTTADVGNGWSITITATAHDITDAVVAENSFNDPPPAGFRFIGVDVTYTFNGTGSDSAFTVTTSAVADSNVALSNECGVIPTPLDEFVDVFAGGSISGLLCFVVPADSAGFAMYSSASFDIAPVWFATT